MNNHRLARTAAIAVAGLLLAGLTACTNTEGVTSADGSSSTASGLGAGGNAIAAGVTADPAVVALVPQRILDAGVLELVTDPTYAPIDFTDSNGDIIGLEPDLALAVGKKMGVDITISKADFNGILAGLESKRWDASWAAFSVTPERINAVDMVSFMAAGTAVMTKKGAETTITTVEDLCGLTIAVQTGTTQALSVMPTFEQMCIDAGLEKITPLVVPQQDSANQAVASGRAEAMIADNALVAYYAQVQPEAYAAVSGILVEPALIGVAMPKSDDGLAKAFQAAIQSLMDDGSYLKILTAWSLQDSMSDSAEINPIVQ
ncbi:MAG: ABC transporter substrate-binding protein [Rhodoglobus sp.]